MKEGHWNRCLMAAGGRFLVGNMFLEGKRLSLLPRVVVARMRLFLSGISDTISIANTSLPDSEVASSANQADNSSSATATITITWQTLPLWVGKRGTI